MTPLTLYIYSNNTDLHCISAFESIKQMMPNTPIQKLQRYRKFTFSFNETTTEKAQSHLSQLLDTSYDILNPNKESYYLDQLPRIKTTTSCSVDVLKQHTTDDNRLCQRLQSKYPTIPLQSLKQSITWTFIFSKKLSENDVNATYDQLILTTSRTSGLFVNPLFETASLYSIQNSTTQVNAKI